jgi:hypothetical protein
MVQQEPNDGSIVAIFMIQARNFHGTGKTFSRYRQEIFMIQARNFHGIGKKFSRFRQEILTVQARNFHDTGKTFSRYRKEFFSAPDCPNRPWDSPSLLLISTRSFSLGVKFPRLEVHHLPLSNAVFKN